MAWLGTWENRRKITISDTNVDAVLSNFPILVAISSSSGTGSADLTDIFDELTSDANRKKIAVTTSDGTTQCYVEIERWDDTSEKAELWVNVPSVASGSVTELYIYYDSAQADNSTYVGDTTESPAQSAWNSNFKFVAHMAQDPNGDAANAIKDSTSNANHGTPAGSMTSADLVNGRIGKCIDFDGSNDTLNHGNAVNASNDLAVFCIINSNATTEARSAVSKLVYPATDDISWLINTRNSSDDDTKWNVIISDDGSYDAGHVKYYVSSDVVLDGNDHLIGFTFSSGTLKLYCDGVEDTGVVKFRDDAITTLHTSTESVFVGAYNDGTQRFFLGTIDEVIASTATQTTAAWTKATYYSAWDGLVAFGIVENPDAVEAEITAGVGVSDAIIAINTSVSISAGVGISDSLEAIVLSASISAGVGMSEDISAEIPGFSPGVTADCGNWRTATGYFSNSPVQFGWIGDIATGLSVHGFSRFPNVTIPRGAKILAAKVVFTAHSQQGSGVIAETNIYANATDDSVAPTTAVEAQALPLSSSVEWDIVGVWSSGDTEETPDISTPIQQIIDRAGWNSGQALTLLIHGYFSHAGDSAYRSGHGFSADSPTLVVSFEVAGELVESVFLSDSHILETLSIETTFGVGLESALSCMVSSIVDASASVGMSDSMLAESLYATIQAEVGLSDSWSAVVNCEVVFSALDYKVKSPASTFHSTADYQMTTSSFGSLSAGVQYDAGIMFSNVNIPFGTIITSAFVRFVATDHDLQTGVCNAQCFFNVADNPDAPESVADYENLALTAPIDWDAVPAWTEDVAYDSPELVSILQAIIDRPGWETDNTLQFVVKDHGSDALWAMRDYNTVASAAGTKKAELHICFDRLSAGIKGSAGLPSSTNSVRWCVPVVQEALTFYGQLKWAWQKAIIDNMDFAEALENIYGITIKDWMSLVDAGHNQWSGTETATDTLFVYDIAESVKAYYKLISEGMDISEAASVALRMMISDVLTCVETIGSLWTGDGNIDSSFGTSGNLSAIKSFNDLISDGMSVADAIRISLVLSISDKFNITPSITGLGMFRHKVEETLTLEDIINRAFHAEVSDSMNFAGISLAEFLALITVSESFGIDDTVAPGLGIKQIISDAFEVLDATGVKLLLHELIEDGMGIEVSVILEGEAWECWVLNTSAFHVSVYSGYNYNSYAVFNDIAYGCKSDGIYELSGDDDDGAAFHSGIILPQTNFGADNKKRFRRAWMGVSGNDLTLKVETETGNKTYQMVDSEIGITRDLKGRSWTFSLEDFDSLDSISLVPVILSKR